MNFQGMNALTLQVTIGIKKSPPKIFIGVYLSGEYFITHAIGWTCEAFQAEKVAANIFV